MDYYTNQSYYDILGVKQDASLENIQKARERLKFGDPDDRAPFSQWGKIDEAYNVLSNSEKRKEYDKVLEENKNIYSHSDFSSSLTSKNAEDMDLQEENQNTEIKEEKNQNAENKKEETYDLNFVTEFNPKQKNKISEKKDFNVKTVAKYVGGTLVGYLVAGPIGAIAVPIWMKKHKKISLQKQNKPKKITKIVTPKMKEFEIYNKTLDNEVNKLLSEPHNSYKLEINRKKYENKVILLEKILDIKLSKKVKKIGMLNHKLDVISTKMQLETAKKNLSNIQSKIDKYEKEQGLSKVNKELIKVNKQLAEQKGDKSFSIRKLEFKQAKNLKKRNFKAKLIKTSVLKSGKMYDGLLYAKDFVKSLPYMFKSAEKLDEYMSEQVQQTR